MHLYDKRVFNFTDSLYAAIERSQGFAMEIHPDSAMQEFFRQEEPDASGRKLLKEVMPPADFAKVRQKLQQVFHKAPEKVTLKEYNSYQGNYSRYAEDRERMPTSMDVWLYNLARRQGKWVGGVEDVSDQWQLEENNKPRGSVNDFLTGNNRLEQQVEKMTQLYLANDLAAIWAYIKTQNAIEQDPVNIRRNQKMARRIDSLVRIRSMVFALGTAHLPGEAGVISLLRKNGYTVEPVFSGRRTPATDYRYASRQLPWVPVHAMNSLYTVEMPGEPHQKDTTSSASAVNLYADATTNLLYAAMSLAGEQTRNRDSIISAMLKAMGLTRTEVKPQPIRQDGLEGVELMGYGPALRARVRIFFSELARYAIMVGSETNGDLQGEDAERFFRSFVMHSFKKRTGNDWFTYNNLEYGISLPMPGVPYQETALSEDSAFSISQFTYTLWGQTATFKCIVQEVRNNYYLTGDTSLLNQYPQGIASLEQARLISTRPVTIQGYPGLFTEFMSYANHDSAYCKVLNLHRGNRIIFLMAVVSRQAEFQDRINLFFDQFRFIPVREASWSMQSSPDNSFSAWAPAPINNASHTEYSPKTNGIMYVIFDKAVPTTYFIRKFPLAPYYWAGSDSSYYHRRLQSFLEDEETDTLLWEKRVSNGPYKGYEGMIRLGDNHNLKKVRTLIAGDTLYELYGQAPEDSWETDDRKQFFEKFVINTPYKPTTVFTEKKEALLAALKDPARNREAVAAIAMINWTAKDLPWLYKAMLDDYPGDGQETINNLFFEKVGIINDPSTETFVQQAWTTLPVSSERYRYQLLALLAQRQTPQAMQLMKQLLLQHPPSAGSPWALFSRLQSNPALLAPVFPDLLPLLADTLAGRILIVFADKLLDSSLLTGSTLLRNKKELYTQAEYVLRTLNNGGTTEFWYGTHLFRVLGRLKEYKWLKQFTRQPDNRHALKAAMQLLQQKQRVDAAVLKRLAADSSWRLQLYQELESLQQESLFPQEYYSQAAFGESELVMAQPEEGLVKISYLGEELADLVGQPRKFLLYRLDFAGEKGTASHLGIAGPYAPGSTKPWSELEATGVLWSRPFDPARLKADLDLYLKELIEKKQ